MLNIDDRILDHLDANELQLVLFIARRMKSNRMTAWPSIPTLATEIKCDPRTIRTTLFALVQKGFVQVEYRTGQSSVYSFRKTGISVFAPIDDHKLEEKQDENYPPQKLTGVPPSKNVPPSKIDPSQKLSDEVINNNSLISIEEKNKNATLEAVAWATANPRSVQYWHETRQTAPPENIAEEISNFFGHHFEKHAENPEHRVFTQSLNFFKTNYPKWITTGKQFKKKSPATTAQKTPRGNARVVDLKGVFYPPNQNK